VNNLFGTSGIRGDAKKLFTPQFCFDLGRTFSQFLTKHKLHGPVAVGMDPRGSSPKIKKYFISGLVFEGREVLDEGGTPVPSMCYLLQLSNYLAGSAMITGSHIKDYLNGIKFFANKEEILKAQEKEINEIYYKLANKKRARVFTKNIQNENRASEEYKLMLLGLAKTPYPKWKIVTDPGNGAQSDIMPLVLRSLGADIIEINSTIQGNFFARDTENEPDFALLKDTVKKTKADFGIAWDGDGDRCIFIGKEGRFIPGDYTASIVARESNSKSIVTTIAASQVVDYLGKNVIRTKVGSPYVIEAMKKTNSKFGFEPNGGGISSEIMYTRDGGSTTIKFLNILKDSRKSFEGLIAELPKFYLSKAKVDYPWSLQETILSSAKENFKGIKIDETDGLKIWIDKTTWILFRSSQNAPEFRVFAESLSKTSSEKLLSEGIKFVKKIINAG